LVVGRWIELDVHRDFCQVAIADGGRARSWADCGLSQRSWSEIAIVETGRVRSAGRIATGVPDVEPFAGSSAPDDVIAVEATTGTDRIIAVLQRHGIRVVVANTRKLRAITDARAKTDRVDARTLGKLLIMGFGSSVDAGRADAGAAAADQSTRADRARQDAREERGRMGDCRATCVSPRPSLTPSAGPGGSG
jgi:hypothetical protein